MSDEEKLIGRRQFYEQETLGKKPENPHEYYNVLSDGKKMFNLISTEYRQMYYSGWEWWGLYQLHVDWTGERYLLKYLLKWFPNDIPEWIFTEDIIHNDIEQK